VNIVGINSIQYCSVGKCLTCQVLWHLHNADECRNQQNIHDGSYPWKCDVTRKNNKQVNFYLHCD